MDILIRSVEKQFGQFRALKDIHLSIQQGEFVALLGPSGSGKTTLLRTIAGLEFPDSGDILFSDKNVAQLSPKERGIGFIFQHYALFKHMTVYDNVAFALTVLDAKNRPSPSEIKTRVTKLLKMVQLDWLADRFPAQLSGGQKQRVALARALAVQPQVLLLDEPFGALDTNIRKELRDWLRELHDRLNMTSIFVTHDVDEALEMADKIVVMHEGKIVQVGTPEDIYHRPANAFVYRFIGEVNLFHGRTEGGSLYVLDQKITATQDQDKPMQAMIRTDSMSIRLDAHPELRSIAATVKQIKHLGHSVKVRLTSDTDDVFDVRLGLKDPVINQLKLDQTVFVVIDDRQIYFEDFQI